MKQTQQRASYRLGHPMTQCGVCQAYQKKEWGQFGTCKWVTGKITAYGLCNRFSALNNPWGNVLDVGTRTALAQVYDHARKLAG